jgi:hypothetical protein
MSLSRVVCDRHLAILANLSLLQIYIIALGTAQFLLVEGSLAQRHSGSALAIVFEAGNHGLTQGMPVRALMGTWT